MKHARWVITILSIILLSGCASQKTSQQETNQRLLRENEYRIQNLENSVNALNNQVSQLNNRVYEVRTRNGQKTSMTVVPILSHNAVPNQVIRSENMPNTTPVSKSSSTAPVQGRKIDPSANPTPLPKTTERKTASTAPVAKEPVKANASGAIGQPDRQAGPSGQLNSGSSLQEPGLPPTELPPTSAAVPVTPPTGKSDLHAPVNPTTPLPQAAPSDISLPPETTGFPPIQPTDQPKNPTVPTIEKQIFNQGQTSIQQPATTPSTKAGEQAAYQKALAAARGGRPAEGIKLFQEFLQQYPNGKLTPNAHYWMGECYYQQGNYQEALSQFQTTVNSTSSKHQKHADAISGVRKSQKKIK